MATYKLLGDLGQGAFGRVSLAESESGVRVALKFFDPSPSVMLAVKAGHVSLGELQRRFFSEATYQAQLAHPNIVRVFESNLAYQPPFFAMELAESTLASDLAHDHTLGGNPQQALFDILAGLEGIHSLGIYHRDLKPQNILRIRNPDNTFRYALSDFGLIKVTTGDSTTLTVTGAQGGTERYAAPELISDFKRATSRSDIFSFGVILYDIFYGPGNRVPYTEVSFSGKVGAVASRCTKKLTARRFANIAELRVALYEALQNEVPQFGSRNEERIVQLLSSGSELSEDDWDLVFMLLEELPVGSKSQDQVLRAFTSDHLVFLQATAPDLLMAFSGYYIEYVEYGRGNFDFNYCDVIADKLTWLFNLGDVAIRAKTLLALLALGVSHNRWFVERRFQNLADATLDAATAERVVTEVLVQSKNVEGEIAHLERSIGVSRNQLHPLLHRLWAPANA